MWEIGGIFDFREEAVEPSRVERMTTTTRHRGPDGAGFYVHRQIGLGHRRLSIIDIEGGAQPITNEDESLHLIFNGEIYNFVELRDELEKKGHIFKTRSDTEVIIHGYEEWGLECVKRFNGIFAFALWDQTLGRLFLARDHLGVKPLYYVVLGNRFFFASEIKSLLVEPECPRAVDIKALGQLFTLRYVPSPDTLFERIKKLPPAHLMVVEPEGLQIQRYWEWPPRVPNHLKERHLTQAYPALIRDAVRQQLWSDIPAGPVITLRVLYRRRAA